VLPKPLDLGVTIAYLLCRIADTLEDETQGPAPSRQKLFVELARLTGLPEDWRVRSRQFAADAKSCLRSEVPKSEVELLNATPIVLEALARLPDWAHPHIRQCIEEMTRGMCNVMRMIERDRNALGLADLDQTLTYCYYVAGTVGEMLTGLFADYSPAIAAQRSQLMPRASAFGRALQLTNILKDIREDLERGSCWLPRREMAHHHLTAETLLLPENRRQAVSLLDQLIGVARAEADVALEYVMSLPASEKGIRLFCIWPLFFAVLTLRELQGNPAVFDPKPVKISRRTVQEVMEQTRQLADRDRELRALYLSFASELPKGREARA
jgi:farnesyl-diphosphate farnesyltransferase